MNPQVNYARSLRILPPLPRQPSITDGASQQIVPQLTTRRVTRTRRLSDKHPNRPNHSQRSQSRDHPRLNTME